MPLELKNISKHFENKAIFKDFSYRFGERGLYAIRGESGIGKTTLLRMIAGLDNDYSGNITGGGIGQVGFAFQEYRLFPTLNALQNLHFAFSEAKSEAECKEMLYSLGFSEADLRLYPDQLSGGMKQRISLARAFISGYPILLLDEPTKELDEKNAKVVRRMIKKLSAEKLIILVSHNDDDIAELSATEILIKKQF